VHGEDHEDFGASDDEDGSDDGPLRGWVPRDDRLWLHPSERAAALAGSGPPPEPPRSAPRGTWVVGGLTVCVVLALVLSGMVVATAGDTGRSTSTGVVFTGVPTTEADLSRLTTTDRMTRLASTARDSTIALVVTTGDGTRVGTGVVAEAGGIVVTLRQTVAGARSVTVVEPDGSRQPAVQVGSDPTTGIVVLRIADDLPVADFTAADPTTGSLAVAMSEEARGAGAAPTTHLYAGTVLYAGLAAGPAQPSGFCGTAIDAPLSADDIGSPLVEPSGAVAGLLDAVEGAGTWRTAIFLPAELVRDVTAQIVANGSVDHGVLGAGVVDAVRTDAAAAATGALVADVVPGSSAARSGLEQGDRIVAVDGSGVRSVAELATRLYAEAPGTELPITFVRGGATMDTTAVLGDS
jgi:S1-C subfamily serine protease